MKHKNVRFISPATKNTSEIISRAGMTQVIQGFDDQVNIQDEILAGAPRCCVTDGYCRCSIVSTVLTHQNK